MRQQNYSCVGTEAMATQSKAALELKRLRDRAGFSVRQLAAALSEANSKYGHSPSSYAYYENDYKKPYLPADLVNALVPIMSGRGDPPIDARQVLVLAGTEHDSLWRRRIEFDEIPSKIETSDVNAALLGDILEQLEAESETQSVHLQPHQKARLAAEIYARTTDAAPHETSAMLRQEVKRVLRLAKAFLPTSG